MRTGCSAPSASPALPRPSCSRFEGFGLFAMSPAMRAWASPAPTAPSMPSITSAQVVSPVRFTPSRYSPGATIVPPTRAGIVSSHDAERSAPRCQDEPTFRSASERAPTGIAPYSIAVARFCQSKVVRSCCAATGGAAAAASTSASSGMRTRAGERVCMAGRVGRQAR
jgi:hypothetical protein